MRASSTACRSAAMSGGSIALTLSFGRSMTIRAMPSSPAGSYRAPTAGMAATSAALTAIAGPPRSMQQLEHDRRAVATGRAYRCDAELHVAAAHLVRERRDDTGTGRAEGMPQRDGSAHDVDAVLVDGTDAVLLEHAERGQHLSRERLVDLEE